MTAIGLFPRTAEAGMPLVLLTEIASHRVEAISFFAVSFVVVSFAVWRLWNGLRRDFPAMPELRFRHAVALILLWGLAFNLVLTMISGARELMTPGAWSKEGATYRLSDVASEPPPSQPPGAPTP